MRQLLLLVLTTMTAVIAVAPAAHATSYGLVIPGDLDTAKSPLIQEVDVLAGQGAKTAKFFVTWDVIEPRDGHFDNVKINQYVSTVRHLASKGISSTIIFFGAEAWLHPAETRDRTPPTDRARFAAAMAELAKAVDGFKTSITVWNEADAPMFWQGGPDPDAYVDLLKRSFAAVRATGTDARVVFTPLTAGNWRFVQAAYDRGAKGNFDAIGVDAGTACSLVSPYEYYRENDAPDRIGQITFLGYREVRKTMLANGDDKPILLEMGWSVSDALCDQGVGAGTKAGGVSPAQQARFLREGAHCVKEDPYVETVYWFEFQDRAQSDAPDHRFGLLAFDGTKRPSYAAFVDVIKGVDTVTGPCGDFQAPQLTVLRPQPGERYADRIDIQAKASDPSGVGRISLSYNGANEIRNFTGGDVGNDKLVGLAPWFKSSELPLGKHTVSVTAIDGYGNRAVVEVPVEKVTAAQLGANLAAVFKVARKVTCKKRLCSFRVSLGRPATGGPSITGKVLGEWQWYSPPKPRKKGVRKKAIPGKWKTLHKSTKPANKVSTFRQKVKRAGRWRLRLTHLAVAPYKKVTAKDIPFRIR